MTTPASQSDPRSRVHAPDDAVALARMVMQAHGSSGPDDVARALLQLLMASVKAPRGALTVTALDAGTRRAGPRLLAVAGIDAALALSIAAEPEVAAGEHPESSLADWARIPVTLDASDAPADGASQPGAATAHLLFTWDEPPTPKQVAYARSYIGALREAIGAVVLSVLAAARRMELERMADERAAALTEAHAARSDWEQTFDAVSDPIAVLSANYRILRVNAAYRQLFGLGRDQPTHHECFRYHDGGRAPCPGCPLPTTIETGKAGYVEREEFVAAGPTNTLERRIFHVWTYPVRDSEGQVSRVVEILKDVTGQERLRQLSTQAEALRAADQMKAELLGTVSHELRSPLAAIKGYASTLLRHERRLPRAERHEFLTAIGDATTRLEMIINHLLEMSQLETGDAIINRFPMDLVPLARDAVADMRAQNATQPRPPTAFAVSVLDADGLVADRAPLIYADPRAMREVLDNLLENAVKYSPQGGEITVMMRPVRESASSPAADQLIPARRSGARIPEASAGSEDYLEVTVSDHGVGIPDDHLGRIFERFHRVDTRLTREVDGLGLGLAICRRIVELHGGAIWAESQPGEGSVFHVLLPIATRAEQQADSKEM